MSWRWPRHRPKSFWTLKQWAATRARHSLMATLGILHATLVAMRPEQPPPAPARGLPDPPQPEVPVTPAFKFVLGVLAFITLVVFVLANLP